MQDLWKMISVDMDVFPCEKNHNTTRESSGIVAVVCIILLSLFVLLLCTGVFRVCSFLRDTCSHGGVKITRLVARPIIIGDHS